MTTIQTTTTRLFVGSSSGKSSGRVRGRETVALRNNKSDEGNTVKGNAFSSSSPWSLFYAPKKTKKKDEEEDGE
jgi:hypothetical protein